MDACSVEAELGSGGINTVSFEYYTIAYTRRLFERRQVLVRAGEERERGREEVVELLLVWHEDVFDLAKIVYIDFGGIFLYVREKYSYMFAVSLSCPTDIVPCM